MITDYVFFTLVYYKTEGTYLHRVKNLLIVVIYLKGFLTILTLKSHFHTVLNTVLDLGCFSLAYRRLVYVGIIPVFMIYYITSVINEFP